MSSGSKEKVCPWGCQGTGETGGIAGGGGQPRQVDQLHPMRDLAVSRTALGVDALLLCHSSLVAK